MTTTHFSALYTEIQNNLDNQPTLAKRVFHGRGKAFEGMESINIEWYPPYLFVQNYGEALNEQATDDLDAIFEANNFIDAILVQAREWPDVTTTVTHQRNEIELPISDWTQLTDDIQCQINLGKNRNTGVFLDMRSGWDWVKSNSNGKSVLNLFCYTGVFSLFALKGGATKVDNVDMAANVLKIAQRNHQLNDVHDGQTAFYRRNILKSDRWFENRDPYDLIIIDPPPYQKKAFHGWQDYEKLLRACKQCLAPNGTLLTCLNNPQVTIHQFLHDLDTLFPEAKTITPIPTADEVREKDPDKGLKVVSAVFSD